YELCNSSYDLFSHCHSPQNWSGDRFGTIINNETNTTWCTGAAQLECKPLAGLQALKDKSLYLTLNINPESLIPMNQTIRRSEMLAASMAQKQNDVRLFFFFPVPAIFKHVTRGTDEEMLTMDIRISHFLTRVQPSGLLGSWSKF
ncbi:hypothetical protein PSHT_05174, partial [Puccinia striiformis]